MDDVAPHHAAPAQYTCPHCSELVDVPAAAGPFIECPACGASFSLPDDEGGAPGVLDYSARAAGRSDADFGQELNGLRIRQLSSLRRGATRSRSWFLIGAFLCAGGALQLVAQAARAWYTRGLSMHPLASLTAALLLLIGMVAFWRRAAAYAREIREPFLQEPTAPPDFSTLSDGSQHWQALSEMNDPNSPRHSP